MGPGAAHLGLHPGPPRSGGREGKPLTIFTVTCDRGPRALRLRESTPTHGGCSGTSRDRALGWSRDCWSSAEAGRCGSGQPLTGSGRGSLLYEDGCCHPLSPGEEAGSRVGGGPCLLPRSPPPELATHALSSWFPTRRSGKDPFLTQLEQEPRWKPQALFGGAESALLLRGPSWCQSLWGFSATMPPERAEAAGQAGAGAVGALGRSPPLGVSPHLPGPGGRAGSPPSCLNLLSPSFTPPTLQCLQCSTQPRGPEHPGHWGE